MEILAIANQKGGVGKTTTAVNLSAALSMFGQETLLIDLDPQSNATSGLGFGQGKTSPTIYQVLLGHVPITKAIKQSSLEWLDIICAERDLIGAQIELVSLPQRESRLRNALLSIGDMYQFVIIDTPPSLGLLTVNALTAATSVLIPVQSEYYALEGLAYLMNTIDKVRQSLNPGLHLDGAVLTMHDSRVTLAHQVRTEVERFFSQNCYSTVIPRSIRLAEAPSYGQPIFQYDPRSKGGEAYLNLAAELLKRRNRDRARHLENHNHKGSSPGGSAQRPTAGRKASDEVTGVGSLGPLAPTPTTE